MHWKITVNNIATVHLPFVLDTLIAVLLGLWLLIPPGTLGSMKGPDRLSMALN